MSIHLRPGPPTRSSDANICTEYREAMAEPGREAVREAGVPAAARRRRVVVRLGGPGQQRPLAGHLGVLAARRQPLPGRRLADLHDLRLDADLRPAELPARDRRARPQARGASPTPSCSRCRAPTRSRPSTASPAGRCTTCAGRASASRTCSTSSSRCPRRRRSASTRSRCPTTTRSRSSRRALHDVMLALEMDGAAALAPARLAGARRDPGDVRLQGRQVAHADRARRPPADRLLGRARLRPERVGRPLEWLRHLSPSPASAAGAAPSARVHWIHATAFCVLLGSRALPLPAEPRRGGRPAPAAEDDPHLHRGRVGGRARARRRRSATGARCGARSARSTSSTPTTARGSAAATRRRAG